MAFKKAVSAANAMAHKAMEASNDDPRVYSAKQQMLQSHAHLKEMYASIEKILEWHKMPDGGGLTEKEDRCVSSTYAGPY